MSDVKAMIMACRDTRTPGKCSEGIQVIIDAIAAAVVNGT